MEADLLKQLENTLISYQENQETLDVVVQYAQRALGDDWIKLLPQAFDAANMDDQMKSLLRDKANHAIHYYSALLAWQEAYSYLSEPSSVTIESLSERIPVLEYWLSLFGNEGAELTQKVKDLYSKKLSIVTEELGKDQKDAETKTEEQVSQEQELTPVEEVKENDAVQEETVKEENIPVEEEKIEEIKTEPSAESPVNEETFIQEEISPVVGVEKEATEEKTTIEEIAVEEKPIETSLAEEMPHEETEIKEKIIEEEPIEKETVEEKTVEEEVVEEKNTEEEQAIEETPIEETPSTSETIEKISDKIEELIKEEQPEQIQEVVREEPEQKEETPVTEEETIEEKPVLIEITKESNGTSEQEEETSEEVTISDDKNTEAEDILKDLIALDSIPTAEPPVSPIREHKEPGNDPQLVSQNWDITAYLKQKELFDAANNWLSAWCIRMDNAEKTSYPYYGFIVDLMHDLKEKAQLVLENQLLEDTVDQDVPDGRIGMERVVEAIDKELEILPDEFKTSTAEKVKLNAREILGRIDTSTEREEIEKAPDGFELIDDPYETSTQQIIDDFEKTEREAQNKIDNLNVMEDSRENEQKKDKNNE